MRGYVKNFLCLVSTRLSAILPKKYLNIYLRFCRAVEFIIESAQVTLKNNPIGFEGTWTDSVETKPENETNLMQQVATAFRMAKEDQVKVPAAYQPNAALWDNDSLHNRLHAYYDVISRGDLQLLADYLRNFFRNDAIADLWAGIDAYREFCRNEKFKLSDRSIIMIQQYLVWRKYLPSTPVSELDAPRIGNPWGYRFNGMLLYEPVFEYNFHAHYFDRMLHGLEQPVVLEIGGGFGGLAHHLLTCNPRIKYIGLDIPENIMLQTYYLSSLFPDARVLTYTNDSSPIDRKTLENYDIVLLPNFDLPRIASGTVDLIVNVRSLGEMSRDTINEYFVQIDRIGRLFFFHENIIRGNAEGMKNRIPVTEFPDLENFALVTSVESRWPKYQKYSWLVCQENFYVHRHAYLPFDSL